MEKLISVVIPALNEEKYIEKCLQSLEKQTIERDKYEVIVSDAMSIDKTIKIAEKYADKIVCSESLGAGYGRNFGARHAKTSKLAFIDADSIATKTWLEGCLEVLEKNTAGTGPIAPIENNSFIANLFYKWWSFQDWASIKIGLPIFPGFNIAAKKKEFFKIGGFGEQNYTCEDIDLAFKLKKIGSISYNKKMIVKTSNRRVKNPAYIIGYVLNAWNFLLFKKSRTWEEHRGKLKQRKKPNK